MPPLVLFAIPVFIATMLGEAAWARRQGRRVYEAEDTRTSIAMGLGSLPFGALYAALFVPLMQRVYAHRLLELGSGAGAWLAAFFGHDFGYY